MIGISVLILPSVIGSFGLQTHIFLIGLHDPFGVIYLHRADTIDSRRYIKLVQKRPSSLIFMRPFSLSLQAG